MARTMALLLSVVVLLPMTPAFSPATATHRQSTQATRCWATEARTSSQPSQDQYTFFAMKNADGFGAAPNSNNQSNDSSGENLVNFMENHGFSSEQPEQQHPQPQAPPAPQQHQQPQAPPAPQHPPKSSPQSNGGNSNNKPRRHNAAMEDPAFLRKRTDTLLSLDSSNPSAAINGLGSMKVDRKTFHFLIDAWAFSGEADAGDQATALLHKMEKIFNSQFGSTTAHHIRPDVRSYTKVMNAIARSASPNAGAMAETMLEQMLDLYRSGQNLAVKPNTFTYTAVVEAHANSGVPGSAQHAEALCQQMVDKYQSEGDPDVRPTARCFNAAIHAYAKSGEQGAVQRADDLFRQLESLYETTLLEELKPKSYNYNSLITAWANCGQEGCAERAEQVLERMEALYKAGNEDVKPTTVTFNAVIDAYSKSQLVHEHDPVGGGATAGARGEKAETLLRHMEELYRSGENLDAKPNVRSFNSVMNVWAKSGHENSARRAEEILDRMKQLAKDGNNEVQPDKHSFCTVINAWARSHNPNKAERSLNLYKEMQQLYQGGGHDHLRPPTVVAANAVMNACAYTTGDVQERNRAMEISHLILLELEATSQENPDQVTYGTFLKVCANQMPDCGTRDQIVEMIFQKCSKDGQVGNLVLQQLKATTSEESYERLVGKNFYADTQMEDLPKEWWGNVVEGKWRRRRKN